MKTNVGYVKELDAVSIAYDGSVGDIITIEGVRILLPKAPPKTKIWKRSNKKEEQYFQRQEKPKYVTQRSRRSHLDYIDEQHKYRKEGYWFMNNGKPEYITGAHWFLLQWCRGKAENSHIYPDGDFFFFSKAQQKVFYYLEAAWVDPRSYGVIFTKPRRIGASAIAIGFSLAKGIVKRNGEFGMTSAVEKEAKELFARLGYMFRNLPFFFKPDNKGVFKDTIELNPKQEEKEGLNTKFTLQATKESAYDGRAISFLISDESSKWTSQSGCLLKHWQQVRKTLTKGKRITGKALFVSTIEDYNAVEKPWEDDGAGSGDKFLHLFDTSNPKKRNANGRTETGLYKLFISCYEHYEGFIDLYGYIILNDHDNPVLTADGEYETMGVKSFIENELSAKTNDAELFSELRKTPRTERDLRKVISDKSMYDVGKINQQIEYNMYLPEKPYITGNFRWLVPYEKAEFYQCKDGRFYMAWLPIGQENNNTIGRGGLLYPNNEGSLTLGVDPYKLDKTADGRGSKGAIHGYANVNTIGAPNDGFFLEYIDKPPLKEIFFEDVMMACVYLGAPALIESNIPRLVEVMYEKGLTNFSMRRPDKPFNKLSDIEKKFGGIPNTQVNLIESQALELASHITNFVGRAENDKYREVGEMGYMPFNRTMNDWLVFDIRNRTDRDATVSSSLALFGAKRRKPKLVNTKKSTKQLIRFYKRK